jgi:phosphoglycerol transferase MdoB-like AlkP superfamily enzyme
VSTTAVALPDAFGAPLWRRQVLALLRIELRKGFSWVRSFWLFFLAFAPTAIIAGHAFFDDSKHTDANQLGEETLILAVMGDHGESLGEHGEATHGFFVYNSTLKIPLLLSYPGGPQNKRISQPVATVDIAPTLLELASIHDSQQRNGESLLSLLDNKERKEEKRDTRKKETLPSRSMLSVRTASIAFT